MRYILFSLFLLITSILYGQKSPNIIYILADDMGIGDVRTYNKDCKFPTPYLDQMASEGMKGFQEYMSNPDRRQKILERLEKVRQKVYK